MCIFFLLFFFVIYFLLKIIFIGYSLITISPLQLLSDSPLPSPTTQIQVLSLYFSLENKQETQQARKGQNKQLEIKRVKEKVQEPHKGSEIHTEIP